jgi:hypothetical protein
VNVRTLLALSLVVIACSGATPVLPGHDVMTAPMTADAVRAEIERVEASTPLPSGATWRQITLDSAGAYGPYAGGSLVEWQALCSWLLEATAASEVGDAARTATAMAVLETVPGWRAFADPEMGDEGFRRTIRKAVDDALRGRTDAVTTFSKANCGWS